MTAEQLDRLVALCHGAGCPLLLTLSVNGRVRLAPPDPLDADVAAAFNDHQRRVAGGGRLLGPAAPASAAAAAFACLGAEVVERPSPWRLGPAESELAEAWLEGWAAPPASSCPGSTRAGGYAGRRRDQARRGRLEAEIGHTDLLVMP